MNEANMKMLSTADLEAVSSGDMAKVSDQGLKLLASEQPKSEATGAQKIAANPLTRFAVGAASPFLGVAQALAENPISKRVWGGNPVTNAVQGYKSMAQAGGAEGFDVAGLLGSIATPGAAAMKMPMAASFGQKVGQGVGLGALTGAAQPVTEGDFWDTKGKQALTGAAIGAAIPPVTAGVGKLAEVGRNVIDPWLPGGIDRAIARTANKAAGGKRAEVLTALKSNRQIVPGSQAGAGEIAAPAGSAEFSALQRVVEPLKPTAYRDMGKAQDAARVASVRSVGQDKAALDAAEATRSAHAATNYGNAYSQAVKADPTLAQLSQNPYFKDALPDAIKLAEAQGINPKDNLTQFLQYVKLSLDKQVGRTGDTALSNTEREAVQSVREKLIDWMGRKNPAYDLARQQFAAESKPINQMKIGQFLENKLTPALNDSGATANQRGAMYAQALRDAPGTLKRSTGFNRYDDISQVLNPGQTKAVTSVAEDLARKSTYEDLSQRGSSAARELLGDVSPKVPAAGMFSPHYSVARAVLNRLSGKIGGKALEQLATKMQDPAAMARIMEMLPPKDRMAVIQEFLQQTGRVGTVTATVPATTQN